MDRRRKAALFSLGFIGSSGGGGKSEPDDFSGLRFWIAARKEEGYEHLDEITSPKDFSGNNVIISKVSSRPTFRSNAINGLPAFGFNGSNNWWNGVKSDFNFLHQGDSTLIIITQVSTVSTSRPVFDSANSSGENIGRFIRLNYDGTRLRFQDICGAGVAGAGNTVFSAQPPSPFSININVPTIFVARYKQDREGNDYDMLQDMVPATSAQGASPPSTSESVGNPIFGANNAMNSRFSGFIPEIIMYDEFRTDEEINKIIGGLPYHI